MNGNVKTGLALAGGYLLGRTKKAKLAIGFGMFLAGKKLPLDPRELGRLVSTSPVLAGLSNQVRSELVDATKSAASSALTHRMTGLADSLHERTLSLGDTSPDARQDDGTDDDGTDDDEQPVEKPARRRAPSAKASGTGRASADKARKAAAPARKRTASAARKGTAKASGSASGGGARKKTERGGGRG